MSDSRSAVLAAVRRATSGASKLPPASEAWPEPGDLAGAFARACEAAGARCARVPWGRPLEETVRALGAAGGRLYSAVPGVRGDAFAPAELADPRRLDGLELAAVAGAFGVAENGAVWVDAGALPQRAVLWLAEHLVLVVPAAALVPHLHAAYARLRFAGPGFGVFVAGPSKTADIEQALVIGAQGPRAATVLLTDAAA